MNKRYLYFIFVIASGFLSCSEEIKPHAPTFSKLLTGDTKKSWKLVSIFVSENGGEFQRFSVDNDCTTDDYYVFYANSEKTLEINEGGSKCNASDPDIFIEDSWSIENAKGIINFVFPLLTGGANAPYTLKALDEQRLTVEWYTERYIYRFTLNPVKE